MAEPDGNAVIRQPVAAVYSGAVASRQRHLTQSRLGLLDCCLLSVIALERP
jgi:hypothetical protein